MRALAWAGVMLIATGAGIIISNHLHDIGPFAIAAAIGPRPAATELCRWQPPSAESLWGTLLVVMPVVAYLQVRRRSHVIGLFAAVAALPLDTGLWFRSRIVLLAFAAAAVITAIELDPRIALPDEAQAIAAGAIVLATAALLMRLLRGHQRGFVLIEGKHELDEVLQIAAAPPMAAPQATPHSRRKQGRWAVWRSRSYRGILSGAGGKRAFRHRRASIAWDFRSSTSPPLFRHFFSGRAAISCEKAAEKLCTLMCVRITFKSCGKGAENLRIWRRKRVQNTADFLRETGGFTAEKWPTFSIGTMPLNL